MEKRVMFGAVEVGQEFSGLPHDTDGVYVKLTTRLAQHKESKSQPHLINKAAIVSVTVPDPVPPTPEEIQAGKERRFLQRVENLSNYAVDLKTFAILFEEDAAYALANTGNVIEAAARVSVKRTVMAWLEKGPVADVMAEVLTTVLRRARYPEHSTSAMSNLVYEEVTAAYAELVA